MDRIYPAVCFLYIASKLSSYARALLYLSDIHGGIMRKTNPISAFTALLVLITVNVNPAAAFRASCNIPLSLDYRSYHLPGRISPFDAAGGLGLFQAADSGEANAVRKNPVQPRQDGAFNLFHDTYAGKEASKTGRGIRAAGSFPVTGFALKDLLGPSLIVERVADKTIVYLGEQHDEYADHLMELEFIQGLYRRHEDLAIGMEMFERRYQKALDDYLTGGIDEEKFLKESHYFGTWGFNYCLYRDIIQYAKRHGIFVLATNQDYKLVERIAKVGLGALTPAEKALLPEKMDFSDKAYELRLRRAFEMHQADLPAGEAPPVFEYFYQAQIVWDETMAQSIADFLNKYPYRHLVMLAGIGHLAYGSGIPRRAFRRNGRDYAIILPNPEGLLETDLADFVVFTASAKAPEKNSCLSSRVD